MCSSRVIRSRSACRLAARAPAAVVASLALDKLAFVDSSSWCQPSERAQAKSMHVRATSTLPAHPDQEAHTHHKGVTRHPTHTPQRRLSHRLGLGHGRRVRVHCLQDLEARRTLCLQLSIHSVQRDAVVVPQLLKSRLTSQPASSRFGKRDTNDERIHRPYYTEYSLQQEIRQRRQQKQQQRQKQQTTTNNNGRRGPVCTFFSASSWARSASSSFNRWANMSLYRLFCSRTVSASSAACFARRASSCHAHAQSSRQHTHGRKALQLA